MAEPVVDYPVLDGEPTQVLRSLRGRAAVVRARLWDGRQAWLVTRHAEALRVLSDRRVSADATDPNFPSLNPSQRVPNHRGGPARTHEDRQAVIRGLVAAAFTARAVQRWYGVSERIVAEQLAGMLRDGPPADLIAAFAVPVPLRLVCRMLGVPERDVEFVRTAAQMIITRAYESSQPALADLRAFLAELVVANAASPGDGLIGQLAGGGLRAGTITDQELVDLLLILLVAGHTTTASTIALSVLSLLDEPARYRALREDPRVAAPMVEEFLRIQSIVTDGAPRVAKHDLSLAGVDIRAGDAVIVSLASANHDEAVFADPEVFRPHRPEARRHIAFGWGVHRCLGQHLARMELRIALTALARTIPALRLAVPLAELRYARRYQHLHGVRELLVDWD